MKQMIKRVVIVGGGSAGWMCASALSKVSNGLFEIVLVESDEIGTIGVGEATIPQIHLFNNLLGIDEGEFLRATNATIKLGIEFEGWGKRDAHYMHAFGTIGRDLGLIGFHHYWLKAREEGRIDDLWDYSLNCVAAYMGRFAPLDHIEGTPLSGINYAYHFDAGLYAQFLRKYAQNRGVKRVEGRIVAVNLRGEDGYIENVQLTDDRKIEGDLFIDCSGFTGLLISGAMKVGLDDWSEYLPCNRALAVPCASVAPIIPYTKSTAQKAGWQWRIPLQNRTGNGHVYCSDFMNDDEATSILMANLDAKALDEPRLIKFTTGKRKRFWEKNCVAIGLSSGFLEPLESTAIHVIQSSIARLIAFFPHCGPDLAQVEAYNELSEAEYISVRDFIILHYKVNERNGEAFWDHCRHMRVPQSLTDKIELFQKTGMIMSGRDDLFREPAWLQVMWGQGVIPKTSHPLALAVKLEARNEYLDNIKGLIAQAAGQLPLHENFLTMRQKK